MSKGTLVMLVDFMARKVDTSVAISSFRSSLGWRLYMLALTSALRPSHSNKVLKRNCHVNHIV